MVCSLLRQPLAETREREVDHAGPALIARYVRVRTRTEELAAPLSAEDCCVQSMPDASPAKWHLAHTTWFFEAFVLKAREPSFQPFDAGFGNLFNSYYNSLGAQYPRAQRGMLTRPSLAEILTYRAQVDLRMHALLVDAGDCEELQSLVVLGLNHEQQHQELMLSDIKHLLSLNPRHPAYLDRAPAPIVEHPSTMEWIPFDGGVVEIGAPAQGFCFDNERPRHASMLRPYRLAGRPVSNIEYQQFIDDGGYRNPALWLSDGWDWVQAKAVAHPLYWMRDRDAPEEFTLHGLRPRGADEPVVHVSYYEADAFARWSGARLPSEAEWEHAAHGEAVAGHFADANRFHPRPPTASGLQDMLGNVWEWTASAYAAYPGYRPVPGALGEYNGKFMVNQYVLRGGSCATPAGHVRPSYRNFFPAAARWQFSGIRLARDGLA